MLTTERQQKSAKRTKKNQREAKLSPLILELDDFNIIIFYIFCFAVAVVWSNIAQDFSIKANYRQKLQAPRSA